MDGSRFDTWTRRRFGLAAGGLTASLLGVNAFEVAEAKKKGKKKKKRCKKFDTGCNPSGKRKCCKGLACEENTDSMEGGNRCCRKEGQACELGAECCSTRCDGVECFCKSVGQLCSENRQCCNELCLESFCRASVCTEVGDPCEENADCCSNVCDIAVTGECQAPI